MSKVKIIKLGTDSCPPCLVMKPELKKLRKAHKNWIIKDIDIDKNPGKYKDILSIPVTKICVGKKHKRIVGGLSKEDIEKVVRSLQKALNIINNYIYV